MFASPRTKKTKPFPQQEVEKTLSNVVIPMMKETNFAKNVGKDKEETIFTPEFTGSTASGSIPATDESYNSTSTESFFQRFRTKKTKNAFHYTKNDKMYLHIYEKVRGFKVLSYEMQSDGRAQVFNPENGEVYHCETRSTFSKPAKKLTQDAIVFDTKEAAMSERFSINQHRVSKSGSGVLPRVLVQFDCWGQCCRRYGGGSAMKVELAKFIGIVKFLDAPHPISEKQTKHPIYPHLFGKPDYTPPARAPSPRKMKVDKSFDSYFRSKLSTINVTLNYSKDENERDIL